MSKYHEKDHSLSQHSSGGSGGGGGVRPRTVSSPIPYQSPSSSRPLSPGSEVFHHFTCYLERGSVDISQAKR